MVSSNIAAYSSGANGGSSIRRQKDADQDDRYIKQHIEKHNPEYANWLTRDQALLGYLLSSLSRDVLMSVTMAVASVEAWHTLEGMYDSPTQAHTVNIRIALATMKKGTTMMAEYYSKMKSYADDVAASGQPLGDEEFVAYVLTGMGEEFENPLVSSVIMHVEPISPISPPELYSQMFSYEHHVNCQAGGSQSSVNVASHGCGTSWP
jgi:hypothetical protein